MKKLSSERIRQILANAKASLGVEGIEVTEKETEVVRGYLNGTRSENDVLNIINSKK